VHQAGNLRHADEQFRRERVSADTADHNLYLRKMAVGTVIWTSSSRQSYSTEPGSRLQFRSLCRPSAPVDAPGAESSRRLMMPRRISTGARVRANRIDTEGALNREIRENPEIACGEACFLSLPWPWPWPSPSAEDDDPPPF
jgi:hypothetical protein